MKISRILHAGYVFESEGERIAFDPIFENPFSVNCTAYPSVSFDFEQIRRQKFSAVFISHYHDDHCSMQSLNLLDRETPIYMYCVFEEMFSLLRDLGFQKVFSLNLGETISVGAFQVTVRQALDADVDSMFHIHSRGVNVLNVVDSWIDPMIMDRLMQTKWDLILWPFQSMREIEVIAPSLAEKSSRQIPEEGATQLQKLNPKYLVPSSCQFIQEPWSWYRKAFFPIPYSGFQKQIEALLPKTKVIRMNPSVSFEFIDGDLRPAEPLSWVKPIGEQNVDYDYDENLVPQPTTEIAKHFSALTEVQREKVFNYCRSGILEKWRSLPLLESAAKTWKLSIFDEKGVETSFCYRIDGLAMTLNSKLESFDGLTEIPLAKFYGALADGETLTSLYVRVTKPVFEDIVDDPLIRCLFQGEFASYQKAQLRRLTESAE